MKTSTKKVLIVEDEKPMAKALELKLGHAGFDVTVVFDGSEAVAALEKNKFDLMILDLVMPHKDGFAVLQEVQSKKHGVATIVLSNLSQEEDMKKAKDLGASEYFIKSNTPLATIVEKVNELLHT